MRSQIPAPDSRSRRRWLPALAAVLGLVAVQGIYVWVRGAGGPAAGAEWIWSRWEQPRDAPPASFYAVRDFEVDEPPSRARLLVVGDEEYRAYLNGRFLGGNRYFTGAPIDVFDVSEVLLEGGNRLAVQLRSERGGGGLLASLEAEDEDGRFRPLLQTNASWGIVDRLQPAALRGLLPLPPTAPPKVWGEAPVGRWGVLQLGTERQLPAVLGAPSPVPPSSFEALAEPAGGFDLDWGRPVRGYLTLELAQGSPRLGKVRLASARPGVQDGAAVAESEVVVIAGAGERRWRDALPQRFRHARVRGLPGLLGATVEPAEEEELPAVRAPRPAALEAWAPPTATPSGHSVLESSRRVRATAADRDGPD